MPTSVPIAGTRAAPPRGLVARMASHLTRSAARFSGAASGAGSVVRKATASWMRDSSAGYLSSWRPTLRDAQDDVRQSWTMAAARSVDALHNSGWLAGAIDQASADTIGTGLRLNAKPDAEGLGWDDEFTQEWCRRVERRWRAWAGNPLECDARGKRTIADLTDAAVKQHYAFGEVTALLPEIARNHSRSKLKVMMISPHRLSTETREDLRLVQGVQVDGNGLPVAYRFRRRINGIETDLDVKARASSGRQQVVHVFDGTPDQVRGISPLTPVLKVMRQYDQLADATLTAALIQTIIAATLKSQSMSDEAFEGMMAASDAQSGEVPEGVQAFMEARAEWMQNTSIDLGTHGRIASLFPGDEFELHSAKHPSDNYLAFSRNLLREIARCIGMTYESMTGDNEGATYSSVRMSTSSIWFVTLRRRQRIAIPFVQSIYAAWLEEEIRDGRIAFPGGYKAFLANKLEVLQAEWFGPAKPTADDFKTAKAQSERLENGTTSLAYETADYGLDVETVMEQRAYERRLAERYGLPDPYARRGGVSKLDEQMLTDEGPPPGKRLN